jgi:hypothetical protein
MRFALRVLNIVGEERIELGRVAAVPGSDELLVEGLHINSFGGLFISGARRQRYCRE